ncbi:MAG: hypothetical protein PF489_09410 [Salinivirgaceae bacterium]|jgi:hypothetical protein|nr:hypothetical protein [Salinivirgaceae bacterium]
MQWKSVILIFVLVLIIPRYALTQTDLDYVYRSERLFTPYIATNGYGISFTYLKKQKVERYFFYRVGLGELKHRKEIKGLNPRYPNQQRFIYGKSHHAYPVEAMIGKHRKVVLKNNSKAIGIRYYYGAGINIALVKPAYYRIELVYAQDSSITITEEFDPEFHNVNNIKNRASWFKGVSEVTVSPGFSVELGGLVDFSQRENRIHGVGVAINANFYIIPPKILATEHQQYFFVGFRLYYIWGKIKNRKVGSDKKIIHRGWGMLKKY